MRRSGERAARRLHGKAVNLGLYAFALTVVTTTLLAALLALLWTATERSTGRWPTRATRALAAAIDALPLALFALYAPVAWLAESYGGLDATKRRLAGLVLLSLLGASVVATRLGRRLIGRLDGVSRHHALIGSAALASALLAGAACYAADAKLFPDDYGEFHNALAGGFVAAMAIAAASLRWLVLQRSPRAARLVGRALHVTAATLAAMLLVLDWLQVDAFRPSQALVFSKLVVPVRALSDVDRDGFSALLGGRNCAPFDKRRSPRAIEIPENKIDEDCSGADERWPLAPPAPVPRGKPGEKPNVLFITVDTLRADHLGTYGYSRATSPHLDRLARESVVFERAFAQATKTWDSVPSFLTGLYPSNLPRVYDKEPKRRPAMSFRMRKGKGLMAEAFMKHGYQTEAIVSSGFMVDVGLDRGFRRFRTVQDPTRAARKAIDKKKEPFFIWLHYAGPHAPYKGHSKYRFGKRPIDRYDSEIAREDAQIGGLLKRLDKRGLKDSTIVIINSDHGEEFGEHGGQYHTVKHYRELLHVPLIIRAPGIAPARIADVVELVDIAPTLYELCNVPAPRARLDGQSLLATLSGPRPPELGGALAEAINPPEGVRKNAFFDGRYRLLDTRPLERIELYDTLTDPHERHDIATERPDVAKALHQRLAVRALRSRSPRTSDNR